MTMEATTERIDDGVFRSGDDTARLQAIVERAIEGGRLDGDELRIGIPVDGDQAFWGRAEWYITPDGSAAGKANEMFGALLSEMTGQDIVIHGLAPVEEGSDSQLLILATVRT
jgi:hypothetical protein